MRVPSGVNDGGGEQRQRIADELRKLKQMSNGLRSKALRAAVERAAAQRAEPKAAPIAPKVAPKAPPIAA